MLDFSKKPVLAMIHLFGQDQASKIADDEIEILEGEKVDGVIIENYHGDINDVIKVMKWRDEIEKPMLVGLNVLPNDYMKAFAIASVYNLDFIQVDYVSGKYGRTVEVDKSNFKSFKDKFPEVKVLGGVWPKYYSPLTETDEQLKEDLENAMDICDAIVVTGPGTGRETPLDKIKKFRDIIGDFPLIIGAGTNPDNVGEQLTIADGLIVGSCLKQYKRTESKISRELVKEFMVEVNKVR